MNKVEKNIDFNNKEFTRNTLLRSILFSVCLFIILFISSSKITAISFFVGCITSILYFRMQIIFANTLPKKDLLSKLTAIISLGRVVLIGALLYIVFKRNDLFEIIPVVLGVLSIQFFIFTNFAYNLFYKKKLILNHI